MKALKLVSGITLNNPRATWQVKGTDVRLHGFDDGYYVFSITLQRGRFIKSFAKAKAYANFLAA